MTPPCIAPALSNGAVSQSASLQMCPPPPPPADRPHCRVQNTRCYRMSIITGDTRHGPCRRYSFTLCPLGSDSSYIGPRLCARKHSHTTNPHSNSVCAIRPRRPLVPGSSPAGRQGCRAVTAAAALWRRRGLRQSITTITLGGPVMTQRAGLCSPRVPLQAAIRVRRPGHVHGLRTSTPMHAHAH